MLENIAMWGGVAGCAMAIIAIFAIIIIKTEIKNLLNKDNILFDKNFELKKEAIEEALNIVDELETNGEEIVQNPTFASRAKACYNNLLCVTSKMNIAETFYSLTIENVEPATPVKIAKFKLACRKDIGLSSSGAKLVVRANAIMKSGYQPIEKSNYSQQSFVQPQPLQQPRPAQPVQPMAQPTQPVQRPVQPMQRPVQPAQRPAQPMQRPVQPVQRPIQNPEQK